MPTNPIPRRGRGAPLAAIGLLLTSTLAFAPAVSAAGLALNTPFPSVAVAPGSNVGFDITVTATANQQVALAVSGVPTDWTATLRGGGYVVNGVQADAAGKIAVRTRRPRRRKGRLSRAAAMSCPRVSISRRRSGRVG